MRFWKASAAGLLTFAGLASSVFAQFPTASPIPGPAGGAATSAVGAATSVAGSQKTIWGFFGITKEGCANCKKKFCSSNLGMMVNGMIAPMGAMTGGLIPQCCPTVPTAAEVAALQAGPGGKTGAAAVAATIKQSEADAKARVAAIEYLGTVDCRRWPDASTALAKSLRSDPNECVRFAAARVLNNGCCCTKETIDALKRTVATVPMKVKKDGLEIPDPDPIETSERVRAAAIMALSRCQFLNPETIETPKGEGATPESTPPPTGERAASLNGNGDRSVQLARLLSADPEVRRLAYYEEVKQKPAAQILAEARREIEIAQRRGPAPIMTTGNRSLLHAVARAAQRENHRPEYVEAPTYAQPTMPAMSPVPATAYQPAYSDNSVTNVGAVVETPKARTGGRSLVEIFQRSRGRNEQ